MGKDVSAIDPQQLYSSSQVADLIGKHSRTVRRYVKDGKFPNASRLGARQEYYIPGSDVIAFLSKQSE